ncbi:MAG TPA: hypothetical protein VFN10_23855, partial [Thermoanaerobaculia bacterium]|nr:hypothetical protein [Thermoanaerobaculia bacterium]
AESKPAGEAPAAPLFPALTLLGASVDSDVTLTIRNDGATLRGRTYGAPGYRLIVKLLTNGRVVQDRWLELPGDLRHGETATLAFPALQKADTLQLYHAIQDIPMLEPEPWEVRDVR